jgi:hypothetical protein
MKIYLACEADSRQQAALTKVGYKHRLLSYFYLRKKRRPNILKDIKETGLLDHVERPDTKNADDK